MDGKLDGDWFHLRPEHIPTGLAEDDHPCCCRNRQSHFYWDEHMPRSEEFWKYCHRCVRRAATYRLQYNQGDPVWFDRDLEDYPTEPRYMDISRHLPRYHEVWHPGLGGPFPNIRDDGSDSDSTPRGFYSAQTGNTPSSVSTEQQFYDAPAGYAFNFVDPELLDEPVLQDDLGIYYTVPGQQFFDERNAHWVPNDGEGETENGERVQNDVVVDDYPHPGPEVWNEDGDEDDEHRLGPGPFSMNQLAAMMRMQLG